MAVWTHDDGMTARESLLVRRLIDQGIRDPRVLAAFARVPRSFFVPEESQEEAMAEALELTGRERVLEVGTGSGYATAILAEMMPVSAALRSVEILPELAERARRVLGELGYSNVQVRVGDGALGWPEAAPFDAILVSAAPREVPPALLDQLAPGGRLVLPVGPSPEQQELQLWRRVPSGNLEKRGLMHVRFVPLTGSSQRSVH